MLIVESADMLQAPLFTAEALLRAHGNSELDNMQTVLVTNTDRTYSIKRFF